ncbi:hypothetical protein GW17_00004787 [Ensete ventricosum]|nr:hypothetical protein GW17_00004787 [Ensete ventricosum]
MRSPRPCAVAADEYPTSAPGERLRRPVIVVGTRSARYRVVLPKIDRRRPIEGEIHRQRGMHYAYRLISVLYQYRDKLDTLVWTGNGKTHTAWYIPVRHLTGMRTGPYRAVPLRSIVNGRFRSSTVDFRRRWSISAVCGRFKEKSTVVGRLRKKKEIRRRGKEEEEEEEKSFPSPGVCPRAVVARATLAPSPPAVVFLPTRERV